MHKELSRYFHRLAHSAPHLVMGVANSLFPSSAYVSIFDWCSIGSIEHGLSQSRFRFQIVCSIEPIEHPSVRLNQSNTQSNAKQNTAGRYWSSVPHGMTFISSISLHMIITNNSKPFRCEYSIILCCNGVPNSWIVNIVSRYSTLACVFRPVDIQVQTCFECLLPC